MKAVLIMHGTTVREVEILKGLYIWEEPLFRQEDYFWYSPDKSPPMSTTGFRFQFVHYGHYIRQEDGSLAMSCIGNPSTECRQCRAEIAKSWQVTLYLWKEGYWMFWCPFCAEHQGFSFSDIAFRLHSSAKRKGE